MAGDSSDIDAALVSKLASDTSLLAIATNGVYFHHAPPNMSNVVIVSLVDEVDEQMFSERAFEDALYVIEAQILETNTVNVNVGNSKARAAAARIDVLLEDQLLIVAGYSTMTMHRESRIRVTEPDAIDTSILWYRRGGNYRIVMST